MHSFRNQHRQNRTHWVKDLKHRFQNKEAGITSASLLGNSGKLTVFSHIYGMRFFINPEHWRQGYPARNLPAG